MVFIYPLNNVKNESQKQESRLNHKDIPAFLSLIKAGAEHLKQTKYVSAYLRSLITATDYENC